MSVPEFILNEYVNVIFLNNDSEIDKYNAKIIKVNEDKTYNVLINDFVNKDSIYNNFIAKKEINDKYTEYNYKNDKKTLEIQNIKPFIQLTSGGSSTKKKLFINITKLGEPSSQATTQPSSQASTQPTTQPSSQASTQPTIEQVYSHIKDNIKGIITDLRHNNNINLQELLEMAQKKLQQNPDFASMSNSKLVLFTDPGDTYGFFSNISLGLFDEFKEMLTERGFDKSVKVARMTTIDRLKKYFYLLHSVNPQGFTVLQYACYYNRLDIVILILSYLVAGERNYVQKYINYYNIKGDGRAIDLIDKSGGLGIKSSAVKGVNLLKRSVKNLASFNVPALAGDIGKNLVKGVSSGLISSKEAIEFLLQQFGSKNKGAGADSSNVNIHEKFNNEIFINPSNKSNVSMVASGSSQAVSTTAESTPVSSSQAESTPATTTPAISTTAPTTPVTKPTTFSRITSYLSPKRNSTGGKYKSRRYRNLNKRFTRRKM